MTTLLLESFISTGRHPMAIGSHAGGNHDCSARLILIRLLFFALSSGLPRFAATEGLFLLAWPKRNKNPRLASFLVKSYGNLICGSIEALTIAYSIAPALILPWAVGL